MILQSSADPTANLDPYEYVTICRPRADLEAENDAKPVKQRLEEDELFEQNICDGGTDCMCNKVGRRFVFCPISRSRLLPISSSLCFAYLALFVMSAS